MMMANHLSVKTHGRYFAYQWLALSPPREREKLKSTEPGNYNVGGVPRRSMEALVYQEVLIVASKLYDA